MINFIPNCFRDANSVSIGSVQDCLLGSSGAITYWIGILLGLTGIVSFSFVLVGAFNMLTAFGNETKYTGGKKTVTYAAIGVIISTLSLYLVNLVISILGGTPVNLL